MLLTEYAILSLISNSMNSFYYLIFFEVGTFNTCNDFEHIIELELVMCYLLVLSHSFKKNKIVYSSKMFTFFPMWATSLGCSSPHSHTLHLCHTCAVQSPLFMERSFLSLKKNHTNKTPSASRRDSHNNIGCFLPLEVCIASSSTMKAGPQGGGSQVRSSFDPESCVRSARCLQQYGHTFNLRDATMGSSNNL